MAEKFSFRIGHCAQCDAQIMTKDADHVYKRLRPNFRQAKMVFPDKHSMIVAVCSDCVDNLDYEKVLENILGHGTQSGFSVKKEHKFKEYKKRTPEAFYDVTTPAILKAIKGGRDGD